MSSFPGGGGGPGGGGPGFPPGPGRGIRSPGFFEQWFSQDAEVYAAIAATRGSRASGPTMSSAPPSAPAANAELLYNPPLEVMLQAAVTLGERTTEGHVIEAVAVPWLALLDYFKRHPEEMHEIGWRKMEELIAAGYADSGYRVTLTPASGDKGRDVIATKHDGVSVRILEQVKAYRQGHLVTLEQVHSMLGVLSTDLNVSKGIITTTSDFAPGVYTDENVKRYIPYRLDLRPKENLLEWLADVAKR
jgi:restriction system protein